MLPWIFYPVFVGTLISVVSLTHLAVTQRANWHNRTLSELATTEPRLLRRFRNILLVCGSLFAITIFGFIVPNAPYTGATFVLGLVVIVSELLVGVVPAHKKTKRLHEGLGVLMGVGMLGMAYLFWFSLDGGFSYGQALLAGIMTCLVGLMLYGKNKSRFVVYELFFIFASHLSMASAALALS